MKKILIVLFVAILVIIIFPKSYTSSLGRVREETRINFEKTKKECVGISILINRKDTWVDAPGQSLCFGWFK